MDVVEKQVMDDIQVMHWLMGVEQLHYSYSNDCPKQ